MWRHGEGRQSGSATLKSKGLFARGQFRGRLEEKEETKSQKEVARGRFPLTDQRCYQDINPMGRIRVHLDSQNSTLPRVDTEDGTSLLMDNIDIDNGDLALLEDIMTTKGSSGQSELISCREILNQYQHQGQPQAIRERNAEGGCHCELPFKGRDDACVPAFPS